MSRFSWLAVMLLLVIWTARLLAIEVFPPFVDEAFHINFGRSIATTGPLAHAEEGRQLVIWWFMLFQAGTNEPVFVARVAGLLLALPGAAAFMALGRLIGGYSAGLLAGVMLLLSTYHHFFERLALADPASNGLALAGIYLTARLIRQIRLSDAALAGGVLFAAFSAKVSALPYLTAPLAGLLLPARRSRPAGLWALVALGGAVGLSAVWSALLAWRGHDPFFYLLRGTDQGDGPLVIRLLSRIPANFEANIHNLLGFWGLLLPALGLAALLWMIWRRHFFLPSLIVVPWAVFWLNNRPDTRHLMTPVSLLLLAAVLGLCAFLRHRPRPVQIAVLVVVLGAALAQWLPFRDSAAHNPQALALPDSDYHQYLASESSGSGFDALVDVLQAARPARVYGLLANCLSLELTTLGNLPVICPPINPNGETLPELAALLLREHPPGTYAIVEQINYIPQVAAGELVAVVERPRGGPSLRVYHLASAAQ